MTARLPLYLLLRRDMRMMLGAVMILEYSLKWAMMAS